MTKEEALNKIKNWTFTNEKDLEVLQTLIPELKESENERIRKAILELVKKHSVNHERCQMEIWLEKQKEQKLEKYSPLCNMIKDKIREYIANHFIADTVVKTDMKSIVKAMEEGVRLGKKEQKPTGWSEEDINRFGSILSTLAVYSNNPNTPKEEREGGKKDYAWFNELYHRGCPQPHWKLSEQEKGALSTAIHVLTDERNFPKAAGHLQAILDAFDGKKSRKDWKPSKEQMEALKNVCGEFGMSQLNTLYRDLQKLI